MVVGELVAFPFPEIVSLDKIDLWNVFQYNMEEDPVFRLSVKDIQEMIDSNAFNGLPVLDTHSRDVVGRILKAYWNKFGELMLTVNINDKYDATAYEYSIGYQVLMEVDEANNKLLIKGKVPIEVSMCMHGSVGKEPGCFMVSVTDRTGTRIVGEYNYETVANKTQAVATPIQVAVPATVSIQNSRIVNYEEIEKMTNSYTPNTDKIIQKVSKGILQITNFNQLKEFIQKKEYKGVLKTITKKFRNCLTMSTEKPKDPVAVTPETKEVKMEVNKAEVKPAETKPVETKPETLNKIVEKAITPPKEEKPVEVVKKADNMEVEPIVVLKGRELTEYNKYLATKINEKKEIFQKYAQLAVKNNKMKNEEANNWVIEKLKFCQTKDEHSAELIDMLSDCIGEIDRLENLTKSMETKASGTNKQLRRHNKERAEKMETKSMPSQIPEGKPFNDALNTEIQKLYAQQDVHHEENVKKMAQYVAKSTKPSTIDATEYGKKLAQQFRERKAQRLKK